MSRTRKYQIRLFLTGDQGSALFPMSHQQSEGMKLTESMPHGSSLYILARNRLKLSNSLRAIDSFKFILVKAFRCSTVGLLVYSYL